MDSVQDPSKLRSVRTTCLVSTVKGSGVLFAVGTMLGALALVGCGERSELLGVVPSEAADGGAAGAGSRPHFEPAQLVAALNVPDADDEAPTLTADLLEIYFMSARGGTRHLWASTRASPSDAWQAPHQVSELDTDTYEFTPSVSLDGLRLWFCVGSTPTSVWFSTRASRSDPWNAPVLLTDLVPPSGTQEVNSPSLDKSETMLGVSLRGTGTAGWDLYTATRTSTDDAWSPLIALGGVNEASKEYDPALGNEGTELFFSSSRSGMDDLFWSQRGTRSEAFAAPIALDELNTPDFKEFDPFFALDRSLIFFASNRGGYSDIYQAARSEP